jgi:hypothetical protein
MSGLINKIKEKAGTYNDADTGIALLLRVGAHTEGMQENQPQTFASIVASNTLHLKRGGHCSFRGKSGCVYSPSVG